MGKIYDDLLYVLKNELVTAVGCTEPAAVAYACATARHYLADELKSLHLQVSRDVFKNGLKVGIPGTKQKGLLIAAAMGYVCGDEKAGLAVLHAVDPACMETAGQFAASGIITIDINYEHDGLYILAEALSASHRSKVIIEHEHNRIAQIEVDGRVVLVDKSACSPIDTDIYQVFDTITPKMILEFADTADIDDLSFVYNSVSTNIAVAEEGLKKTWGLNIGSMLKQLNHECQDKPEFPLTISRITRASALAAAASDARMSGCSKEVVINSGSGNQGITASLPVYSIAEDLGLDRNRLIRALTVSHLFSLYQKHFSDRISAFCGAVTAAVGAGCGAAYLLGGSEKEIEYTINTALGGISGMICDGAKPSCALKISLAVQNGLLACALALQGRSITPGEGIVDRKAEKTVKNIGKIAKDGMSGTDEVILNIMLD